MNYKKIISRLVQQLKDGFLQSTETRYRTYLYREKEKITPIVRKPEENSEVDNECRRAS